VPPSGQENFSARLSLVNTTIVDDETTPPQRSQRWIEVQADRCMSVVMFTCLFGGRRFGSVQV
jgi:hypothetical protein